MQNKFPGKDISLEDLKDKIPLAAKKYPSHKGTLKGKFFLLMYQIPFKCNLTPNH